MAGNGDHEPGGRPQPWDRLAGETEAAWKSFQSYLKLGSGRSLAGLGGRQKGVKGASKGVRPPGHIYRWSADHRWADRADAWDRHVASVQTRALEEAAERQAREDAEAWARRVRQFDESRWGLFSLAAYQADELAKRLKTGTPPSLDEVRQAIVNFNLAAPGAQQAIAAHVAAAAPGQPDSDLTHDEQFAAMRAINEVRRSKLSEGRS